LREKKFTTLNETELKHYESSSNKLNAEEQYRLWMHKRYTDFKELMIDYLIENDHKQPTNALMV
jgi:hypothetical protein